jgi:hypothetical protein
MVGGPLCGESLTMKDGRMPNSVPVFDKGKFYVYNLVMQQSEDWTTLHYQYSNEILPRNEAGGPIPPDPTQTPPGN